MTVIVVFQPIVIDSLHTALGVSLPKERNRFISQNLLLIWLPISVYNFHYKFSIIQRIDERCISLFTYHVWFTYHGRWYALKFSTKSNISDWKFWQIWLWCALKVFLFLSYQWCLLIVRSRVFCCSCSTIIRESI